jgi:hypothetical protein
MPRGKILFFLSLLLVSVTGGATTAQAGQGENWSVFHTGEKKIQAGPMPGSWL